MLMQVNQSWNGNPASCIYLPNVGFERGCSCRDDSCDTPILEEDIARGRESASLEIEHDDVTEQERIYGRRPE
jgi:hypothetical protein